MEMHHLVCSGLYLSFLLLLLLNHSGSESSCDQPVSTFKSFSFSVAFQSGLFHQLITEILILNL